MGIFANLLKKTEHRSLESVLLGLGSNTATGVTVTPDNALTSTAVWACVRVISESVAGLPLLTYRRRADGGKERATDHPLYSLLHDSPNPEQTAFEFREMMAAHVCAWGNAYANIDWSSDGQPRALWPMNPSKMEKAERRNGTLFYLYRMPDGTLKSIRAMDILHFRGLSGDGTFGYSPIRMHMESIGLGLATQEYGARFFGNGARPGGVLQHPGKLSAEAQARLVASFNEGTQGLSNAHRLKVIEEGMTYQQIGIPPEEAQFLETRKFQLAEIARIYRVPPHMIQDLERATFSNIEHQSIDFVVHSLRPWLVRFEQAYTRQLLLPAERKVYFVEHLVDGLLRGDISSRYTAYNTGIMAGFLSRNEVRALENMNPADDLDTYLIPLNMMEAGAELPEPTAQEAISGDSSANRSFTMDHAEKRAQDVAQGRQGIAAAQAGILEDATQRVVRREVNDLRRAVDKYLVKRQDVAGFLLWMDEFYREHQVFAIRTMRPSYEGIARLTLSSVARELQKPNLTDKTADLMAFVQSYLEALGIRWAASSSNQLKQIIRDAQAGEMVDELSTRLDKWNDEEAVREARRESVRSVNAFAYAAYGLASVTALRWVARGENCPYCKAMNGRIVGYDRSFMDAGEFAPDGAVAMLIRRPIKHAPLHDGCDCQVIAA